MNNTITNTNINFKEKYPTAKILEITTRKIFEPDGVSGYIETLKRVHGNIPRAVGHVGYKKYAIEVGDKITEKYPNLKQATIDILEISKRNHNPLSKELRILVQPVLDRFEKEIDIII